MPSEGDFAGHRRWGAVFRAPPLGTRPANASVCCRFAPPRGAPAFSPEKPVSSLARPALAGSAPVPDRCRRTSGLECPAAQELLALRAPHACPDRNWSSRRWVAQPRPSDLPLGSRCRAIRPLAWKSPRQSALYCDRALARAPGARPAASEGRAHLAFPRHGFQRIDLAALLVPADCQCGPRADASFAARVPSRRHDPLVPVIDPERIQ
jgi:hypothetical protein